jgi:hypothetical protein
MSGTQNKPDLDPVFEAKIIVTVMGQASQSVDFKSELDGYSLADISRSIYEGDLIGDWKTASVEEMASDQVYHHLDDLRNDGEFFNMDGEGFPTGGERDDSAGRILRAQINQGMSSADLEEKSRAFIEEMGLSSAYAAFLETPAPEADTSPIEDGIEP